MCGDQIDFSILQSINWVQSTGEVFRKKPHAYKYVFHLNLSYIYLRNCLQLQLNIIRFRRNSRRNTYCWSWYARRTRSQKNSFENYFTSLRIPIENTRFDRILRMCVYIYIYINIYRRYPICVLRRENRFHRSGKITISTK